MEVRVFWTETAINQLEQIFDYYKHKASHIVAKKIVSQIVKRTILLEKHPLTGTKEQLLKTEKKNIDI